MIFDSICFIFKKPLVVSELGKLSSFHSETYSSEFSMTTIQTRHFAAPGSFQCPQSAWSTALPRGRSKAGRFDNTKPGVPKLLGADAAWGPWDFVLGFCGLSCA